MKKILSVILVGVCALLCSCDSATDVKMQFQMLEVIDGYKTAEYETYDSPAEENGLGGTKIYVDGTFEKISDDAAIYAILNDGEHNWSIAFGVEPEWTLNDVKEFEGQRVRVFGIYTGFSKKFNIPVIYCVKFVLADTGECHYTMEFSKSLKPVFEGFEEGIAEKTSEEPYNMNQPKKIEDSQNTLSVETTENLEPEEKLVIELVSGELGEYGTPITFNKGTEFEDTVIAYHIPAGEYTATNIGEYMDQFNIYSDEIHKTEEGWEEPAEGVFVKLIDVGATEDFTIEDGQYIKIVEPGKFKIEQK